MQIGLFRYIDLFSRNLEGSMTKLSLWFGMDVTWPLVCLLGVVLFVGFLFADR